MAKATSKTKAKQKAARKRSIAGRIAVWSGILVLLLLVILEWTSQRNYQSTLSALEETLGSGKQVALSDAQTLVRGWKFASEETIDEQKVKTYRWPSLFKRYKLGLVHNAQQIVSYVETYSLERPKQVPKPSNVVVPQAPLPKSGLPAGSEHVVALMTRDTSATAQVPVGVGSLIRELLRQSVLIAAREELGLLTLDASLGETVKEIESPQTFALDMTIGIRPTPGNPKNLQIQIELTRPNLSGKAFHWDAPRFDVPGETLNESFVEKAESLSRKEFVAALESAGYRKSADAARKLTLVADETINRMDPLSQFNVLRQVDALIHVKGETPELLASLVRGYSNLGSLTDFHWSPASKVFKARGLLYAERLVAKSGATPFTLAHRAYARCFAGRHAAALADIQSAKGLAKEGVSTPDWLPLLEAYCSYEPEILDKATGSTKELATYLRMRMWDPVNDQFEAIKAIRQMLTLNSACDRAVEMLSEIPSLGSRQMAVYEVWPQTWPNTYAQLTEIKNLPSTVFEIGNEIESKPPKVAAKLGPNARAARAKIPQVLRQSDATRQDRTEPSWTALAGLLSESMFVEAWRTLEYEAKMQAVNADETILALKPLVVGHPFERLLDSYSSQKSVAVDAIQSLEKTLDKTMLELPIIPALNQFLRLLSAPSYGEIALPIQRHFDIVFEDMVRIRSLQAGRQITSFQLPRCSPQWPLAIASQIESDWRAVESKAKDWEQKYSRSPLVILALSKKYQELQRSADAERCLAKINELTPTHASCLALADVRQQRDDDEGVQEILERALLLPSMGLEQTEIFRRLAALYMVKGDWNRAKPYAQAAAESYAGWGLEVAGRCEEGLENWTEAENYYRAISERYFESSAEWYFWCVRANRGDRATAQKLAKAYFDSFSPPLNQSQKKGLALYDMVDGKLDEAMKLNQEVYEQFNDSFAALRAAILADELNQPATRDSIFESLRTKPDLQTNFVDLVNLFQIVLRDKNPNQWDLNEFELLVVGARRDVLGHIYDAAGKFLGRHGNEPLGSQYLECAATSINATSACLLSNLALRKQSVTVGKTRQFELPDELAPLAELVRKSKLAQIDGRLDDARNFLKRALDQRPGFLPGLIARGRLNELKGDFKAAIADYREALSHDDNYVVAHNNLAWLLSSCEKDEIRNGQEALAHAEQAFQRREAKSWITFGALAAAHAECGNFEKAVEFQRKSVQISPKIPGVANRLNLYESKNRFRRSLTPNPPSIAAAPQPQVTDPADKLGLWSTE